MSIGRIRILASFYGLVFGFVLGDLFGNTFLYVTLGVFVGLFVPLLFKKTNKKKVVLTWVCSFYYQRNIRLSYVSLSVLPISWF